MTSVTPRRSRGLAAAFAVAAAFVTASVAGAVAPTVTNITAAQRPGQSRLVDITYNLTDPDSARLSVDVKISNDGGATWSISPAALTGDVGQNVAPGTGKHIVWDAGADMPGAYGTQYKAMVTATESGYTGEMVYIPAGSFLMGNNGSEPYSQDNEFPQHSVYLSGYRIGKYEVTRGEYRRFIEAGGYSNPAYWSSAGWNWRLSASSTNPGVGPPRTQPSYWAAEQDWALELAVDHQPFTQTESHPVVGVTYYEAEAYCAWADGHLPTEAQWEKAARWTGSYPNVYPWGNAWDVEKCNNGYDHNPAGGGYERYQTAPVGSYPSGASPYGLQDMAGNAFEWCRDWYSGSYYSASPSSDPQGPTSGSLRVLRGGSWANINGSSFRCANRDGSNPDDNGGWGDGGFRLAR